MAATVDTRDLSLVPSITFGFVKSCIKGNGYKYFSEKYVTGTTVLSASTANMVQTKFGRYSTGFPIGFQQKLSTHFVSNNLDAEDFSPLPVKNVKENEYSVVLDQQKCARFSSISITTEECHSIENLTRLQSLDPKWHAIRKDRITASVAGNIVKRKAGNKNTSEGIKEEWSIAVLSSGNMPVFLKPDIKLSADRASL
ncbi:hypothetical protein KUTeg_021727 [Tegillarca granosa]|uniref:Uncharacterized protein n=1 Tax=Tegillarca granosa TaxID=220873 RepID=A0ABQ9EAB7_TEGGR|nr:hypothetical protein KUTeg_021727 [Tegillarca granosa]